MRCSLIPQAACALGIIVFSPKALAQDRGPDHRGENLDSLIVEAIDANLSLKSAEAAVDVRRGQADRAGTLPPPMIMYRRELMPGFQWNEAGLQKFELIQAVPFPSKLSRSRSVAEVHVSRQEASLMGEAQRVRATVVELHYRIWFAQEALRLNSEQQEIIRQVLAIAETRYASGTTDLTAVSRSMVELSKAGNDRRSLAQMQQSAKFGLLALLNRHAGDTLGTALVEEARFPAISVDSLVGLALRRRPSVRERSLALEARQQAVSLASAAYYPDLVLGLTYVTVPTGDFRGWSISAGLSLPFVPWSLGGPAGGMDEAEAALRQSRADLEDEHNQTVRDVRDLFARSRSSWERLVSYRSEIVPAAHQALNSALIGYRTGRTDMLTLLDAYETYVQLSLDALQERMVYESALAGLEKAAGVQLRPITKNGGGEQ